MEYIQIVNGAVYLCTKPDAGPLGLKDVAYGEQNTLLQYVVLYLFYGVLNSCSFVTHKKLSYPHKLNDNVCLACEDRLQRGSALCNAV